MNWNSGKYVIWPAYNPILNKCSLENNNSFHLIKSVFSSHLQKCQYFLNGIKCKKQTSKNKKQGSTSIHLLTYLLGMSQIVLMLCYATVRFINIPFHIHGIYQDYGMTVKERPVLKCLWRKKRILEMWILIIWKADNKLTGLT